MTRVKPMLRSRIPCQCVYSITLSIINVIPKPFVRMTIGPMSMEKGYLR